MPPPVVGRTMASDKMREDGLMPLICPTRQNVFAGSLKASMPATPCYFAWGCFRYFSLGGPWLQSVFALAPLKLRRTRYTLRSPRGCATRSPQGEAWWACLDSNQEPDRYERPALTIELQAPPECRRCGRQRCRHPLQCGWRSGNHRGSIFNPSLPGLTRQSIFLEKGLLMKIDGCPDQVPA